MQQRTGDWWTGPAGLLALVFGVGLLGVASLADLPGRDQGIFMTFGAAMGEGLLPYRDLYDNKPPLTPILAWLALEIFGHDEFAIRKLDFAFLLAASLALARIVRLTGGGPMTATLSAIWLAALYYSASLWDRAQTDGWAAFAIVVAVWFLMRGLTGGRDWNLAAAGAFMGLAFLLKYTIAPLGLLILLPLFLRRQLSLSLGAFTIYASAGLAVLALAAAILAAAGIWADFAEIQSYLFGYVDLGRPPLIALAKAAPKLIATEPVNLALFALGLAAAGWHFVTGRSRPLVVLACAWFALAALSGIVQSKGWPYHFLPILPAAAIFCALGMTALIDRGAQILRPRPAVLATAAILAAALAAQGAARQGVLYLAALARGAETAPGKIASGSFDHDAIYAAAAAVRDEKRPGETMFLWGWDTMLYFLTGTTPRHRYLHTWPFVVTYRDGRYTDDLVTRLDALPPDLIVVQSQDRSKPATGEVRDSREMLAEYPRLAGLIASEYRLVRSLPRFDIYRRAGP